MSYRADISYKSLNKTSEELCGDNVEVIRTKESVILVLADGLGSGVKANILATLTTKIIGTMIKEGARISEAVETIARTLPVCSVRHLAYSTFSILQLFRSGQVYLAQFDNPRCILIRNGRELEVELQPVEIEGKVVYESRFQASFGDVYALISDGVIHAGVGAVLNLGWTRQSASRHLIGTMRFEKSAARLATALIDACNQLYMNRPGDDTTAAVLRVVEEKQVSVFTGPPVRSEDDEAMARDFLGMPGKKIVCGGTSANIVARILDKELTTTLEYGRSDVPPIGYIEGIDLVTEGVLTLSKAGEILKRYLESDADYTFFKELDEKNGASMLARILLEDCTEVAFFVGRAVNPAHQNPELPMDLGIKLKILDELQALLRRLDKNVTARYY